MKLESFKFQDGKVSWLPEYPKEPRWHDLGPRPDTSDYEIRDEQREDYDKAIAQSLASAIEVSPEDIEGVKHYCFMQSPEVSILSVSHLWQPEKDKVYSAECEMETLVIECDDCKETHTHCFNKRCPYKNQVARLKPKDVEIDDAYLNLIIEHHRDRIKWHQSRIDYLQNDPAANSHDMKEGLK